MDRNRIRQTTAVTVPMFVCLVLGLLVGLPGISRAAGPDDEAALRTAFMKQFKDKKPETRIEAVKSLAGVKQEKSIALLVTALKDSSVDVRTVAAATLEDVSDGGGVSVRPLCAILADKKEKVPVRSAAAKALAKSPYKADPIKAMIIAISLDEADFNLYDFGEATAKILNGVAGQDFGMDKETPEKWAKWYKANEPKLLKQDQETKAAHKGK